MGKHVSVQCFGTPASATALLLCGHALSVQYCTISSGTYCVVSHSFIISGIYDKQLYEKDLNKMMCETFI